MEADLLAGRYELGEVIGRGRSCVYAALDTRLGREVAVKRVAAAPGPDELDDVCTRARREARAAARLTSAHVVAVYDVVEEPDTVWLVMELVRAPSLEELVRHEGPLDSALAARIGLGVVDALAAAHRVGVLHRDVKPANVLVDASDDVHVKLADFGVAALRDESSWTLPGLVIGSPSYMAPEQASAAPVGPAADLWALGALLYFAVEGVPPFAQGSALATAAAVVHGEPRPHHHPGPLTPLIDALLVKDPDRRPDIAAVRAALCSAALPPDPATTQITATAAATRIRPYDGIPTGRKRPSRRRAALAAAAVTALLGGAASQLVGVGADPRGDRPPAAEAQPAADPPPADTSVMSSATPTAGTSGGGRETATTAADPAAAGDPAPAGDQSQASPPTTVASPTTAAPRPTTTTTPDEPDTPADPAPTTTTTTTVPPDPTGTTPPTTAPPGT